MKIKLLSALILSLILANCASMQTAQQASDYNGDGLVSDAEYRQFQKQKSVEASNVQVESMKRNNAVDTVRGVGETLNNVHGIRNAIRAF